MRADQAMVSRVALQSTSDQQDPLRYPPIAVAAPLSMPPEQAANWAYPQPDMVPEEIAFTMCTGILGRLYLSGRLDAMSPEQLALVSAGVAVHKHLREAIRTGDPLWPLGLPGWEDPWLALGLRSGDELLVTVWRRPGSAADVVLALPHLRGKDVEVRVAYPVELPAWNADWDPDAATLRLTSPVPAPTARVLTVVPRR